MSDTPGRSAHQPDLLDVEDVVRILTGEFKGEVGKIQSVDVTVNPIVYYVRLLDEGRTLPFCRDMLEKVDETFKLLLLCLQEGLWKDLEKVFRQILDNKAKGSSMNDVDRPKRYPI